MLYAGSGAFAEFASRCEARGGRGTHREYAAAETCDAAHIRERHHVQPGGAQHPPAGTQDVRRHDSPHRCILQFFVHHAYFHSFKQFIAYEE